MAREQRPVRLAFSAVALILALAALGPAGRTVQMPPLGLGQPAPPQAPAPRLLPVRFVPNRGQFAPSVRYAGRGAGYAVAFEKDRVRLSLARGRASTRLTLGFVGIEPGASLHAEGMARGSVSYFLGRDPKTWRTGIPMYSTIVYRGVWPGIDVAFTQRAGRLKYEFRVRPGADPTLIGLTYREAEGLSLDRGGDLVITTRAGSLTDERPASFQRAGGRDVPVASRFVLHGSSYGVATGSYDRGRRLFIDPGIVYSTYLGGAAFDGGMAIAVDASGAAYVTGRTESLDFPATAGALATSAGGGGDAFIVKVAADGTSLVYAAYLGGASLDEGRGVRVDDAGNAYVAGFTTSTDFPAAAAADDSFNGGKDGFVAKIEPSGASLLFSTYLGGSADDSALAIALAPGGGAFVTGETASPDFPATPGALDRTPNGDVDTFVSRIGSAGSLDWATYLGGPGFDDGLAIAAGPNGNAYVTGKASPGHPTTPGAFDTTQNGNFDAFVAEISSDGAQLVYCSYLGGDSWDEGLGIGVDAAGNAYLTGNVQSATFPTTASAWDRGLTGTVDLFVTKVNASGTALVYSTFAGGSTWDEADALGLDGSGRAYVAGHSGSSDYPTTASAFDTTANGDVEAFLTVLDATGSSLAYSTYLGADRWDGAFGLAVDGAGAAYSTGFTDSSTFPTTSGAADTTQNGGTDAFVTKIDPTVAPPTPPVSTSPPTISGSAQQGQTLTASPGAWSGTPPISYAYLWRRCDAAGANCVDIVPVTAPSYTLQSADVGSAIRVVVTATNGGGSAAATSAQTSVVTAFTGGTLTFSVLAGGDDGDIKVSGQAKSGYPPGGTPSVNTTNTVLTIGRRRVSNQYRILTALMRFDTSSLPDDATITAATLRLRVTTKSDADNRNLVGEWYPASNWPIDAADYTLTSSANALGGTDIAALGTGAVNSLALVNLASISKVGFTGLRLHVDGGQPAGDNQVQVASWDSTSLPEPQLVVTYAVP